MNYYVVNTHIAHHAKVDRRYLTLIDKYLQFYAYVVNWKTLKAMCYRT